MTPEQQQQRIMGYFIEEAKDHLQTIEHGVLNLQEVLADPESINELFRAAHSIKGGSAMLGVGSIQHIAHRLEDYFKILKEDSTIDVDERLKSLLLAGFDRLQDLLEHLETNFRISDELSASTIAELDPVFSQLEAHLNKLAAKQQTTTPLVASVVVEPAVNGLIPTFQNSVTAKLRDMLQLFKQNDEPATRQKLDAICGELYQFGEQFQLTSWCDLITKAKQAIASTQNTYRTLAPVLIKDINQAKDLVLANRELEIFESPQLQALVPYVPPISLEEDDEISTIFGSSREPDFTDLDIISESDNLADLTTIDSFSEQAEIHDVADAVDNLDWVNEETGQDRHVDGPKVGASEMKSLATLFENEDIDIESAWEDIETNETQISIHGDGQTQSEQDELTDLLNSSTDEYQAVSELDSTDDDLTGLFGSEFASANQIAPQLDDSDTLFPNDMNFGSVDTSANLVKSPSELDPDLFPSDSELFPNDIDDEAEIQSNSLMSGIDGLEEEIDSEEMLLERDLFSNDFLDRDPSEFGDDLDKAELFAVSESLELPSELDDDLFAESFGDAQESVVAGSTILEISDLEQALPAEDNDGSLVGELQVEDVDPFALDGDSMFDILDEPSDSLDLLETPIEDSSDPFATAASEEIDGFLDLEGAMDDFSSPLNHQTDISIGSLSEDEQIQPDESLLFEDLGFDEDDSIGHTDLAHTDLTDLDGLSENLPAEELFELEEVSSGTLDEAAFDEVDVLDETSDIDEEEISSIEVSNAFEINDETNDIDDEEISFEIDTTASESSKNAEGQITEDLGLTDFFVEVEEESSDSYDSAESDDLEVLDFQPEAEALAEVEQMEMVDFFGIDRDKVNQSPIELGDQFWSSDLQIEPIIESESLNADPTAQESLEESDLGFGEDSEAIASNLFSESLESFESEDFESLEIPDSAISVSGTEDDDFDDPLNSFDMIELEVGSEDAKDAFTNLTDDLDLSGFDEFSSGLEDSSVETDFSSDSLGIGEEISDLADNLDFNTFDEPINLVQESEVEETFDFMSEQVASLDRDTDFDADSKADGLSGLENMFEDAASFEDDTDDIPISSTEAFNLDDLVDEAFIKEEPSDAGASTVNLFQEAVHESEDDFGLADFFNQDADRDQSLEQDFELPEDIATISNAVSTARSQEIDASNEDSDLGLQDFLESQAEQEAEQAFDWEDDAQVTEDHNKQVAEKKEDNTFATLISTSDNDLEETSMQDFFSTPDDSELVEDELGEDLGEFAIADSSNQDLMDFFTSTELDGESSEVDFEAPEDFEAQTDGQPDLLVESALTPQDIQEEDLSFLDFTDVSELESQTSNANQPTEVSGATIDNLIDFFEVDDELDTPQQQEADFTSAQASDRQDNLAFDGFDLSDDFSEDLDEMTQINSFMSVPTSNANDINASVSEEGDMFDDLEAMLGDSSGELNVQPNPTPSSSNGDGFEGLEELLGSASSLSSPPTSTPPAQSSDDFSDLEAMLSESSLVKDVGPLITRPQRQEQRARKSKLTETTMRVDVRHLDSLNNLVGELVVNRNLLEQDQERLQQFINNLLHQVQQLSEVSQRMRDQYDRSLLENSLMAGRSRSHSFDDISRDLGDDSDGTASEGFEGIEFDRYNTFHILSQEIIELIVRVRESASDIQFVVTETEQVTRQLGTITTQIQDDLKQSRMVPFAQIADRLPRGVRERSIKSGKQAELEVFGRETLIDKAILEQLTDPLTHLVNNAIDHGLEDPGTRQTGSKAAMGKITVRAYHQGNQTVISIGDDGAGINPERVKQSAVSKGVRTQSEVANLTDNEVYDLLFEAGFSTKTKADEFSGRGVGLDVVKSHLDEIRGSMYIESAIGRGTTFTIRLPLTLSISKAMFCISDRARIAFPVDGFEDMIEVPQSQIQLNSKGQPCLPWRDTILPFQHLSNLLAYNRHISRSNIYGKQDNDEVCIIILRNEGNYLALQVDQFLGEYEIVIKQLEGPIPKPVGIAGATVLGDGRVMAIANVLELFDIASGRLRPSVSSTPVLPPDDKEFVADPTVLIVDDSITVRELLSLTFAKVGYRVEQARDGQDAWDKLRAGLPCDLIFCDIEMPRMDGLDLLSRLQKEPELSKIPVAMLTSRGADRHRQTAIQLGAKGYFTKPYLEEELLSASQRMLKGEVLVSL
ncbi:response regulator [Tumidithrix elongata RA019]|uniref:histidine kinase n=1 Tax=Tumidithrix elongata BACA0141 TaxID=2716417 RepID=A0AAW9PQE3_9CYAN|nr:response regulator [Tumidithrix elongata RA019]